MSLIQKVKESLKKKAEEQEFESSDDEEEIHFPESFQLYDKKWILAPHMDEIIQGDLSMVPVECIFTHYILRYDYHCLYIALDNHETGDDFEIYEFEFPREEDNAHGIKNDEFEPDFVPVETTINAVDCGKFLAERISEGYRIYIQERIEFED